MLLIQNRLKSFIIIYPSTKKKIIELTTAKAKKSKESTVNHILHEYSQYSTEGWLKHNCIIYDNY